MQLQRDTHYKDTKTTIKICKTAAKGQQESQEIQRHKITTKRHKQWLGLLHCPIFHP